MKYKQTGNCEEAFDFDRVYFMELTTTIVYVDIKFLNPLSFRLLCQSNNYAHCFCINHTLSGSLKIPII